MTSIWVMNRSGHGFCRSWGLCPLQKIRRNSCNRDLSIDFFVTSNACRKRCRLLWRCSFQRMFEMGKSGECYDAIVQVCAGPIYDVVFFRYNLQGTIGCTPNSVPMVFLVFSRDS